MTPAGKPPDLAVDDKAKAGFVKWFRILEAQTAEVQPSCATQMLNMRVVSSTSRE